MFIARAAYCLRSAGAQQKRVAPTELKLKISEGWHGYKHFASPRREEHKQSLPQRKRSVLGLGLRWALKNPQNIDTRRVRSFGG